MPKTKLDLKKQFPELYNPSKEPHITEIPEMMFFMVDGTGYPGNNPLYQEAMQLLYGASFTLKMSVMKPTGKDYVVPPLEGLWWADNMDEFTQGNREKWKWTMMIMQPDWITQDMINEAIKITEEKKPEISKLLSNLRLERYLEGQAAQIMHIGPYSEEGSTVQKVHDFIIKEGGKFDGHSNKHHEIYLSDPRKANPATMKTVIRQPFV